MDCANKNNALLTDNRNKRLPRTIGEQARHLWMDFRYQALQHATYLAAAGGVAFRYGCWILDITRAWEQVNNYLNMVRCSPLGMSSNAGRFARYHRRQVGVVLGIQLPPPMGDVRARTVKQTATVLPRYDTEH